MLSSRGRRTKHRQTYSRTVMYKCQRNRNYILPHQQFSSIVYSFVVVENDILLFSLLISA